ncbi:hypothetical protein [Arcobacter sp. F2176]|uniref:hypothetical protein n=1 Tax=Arcobacter sp. F2176 TaxID=2044511 RepID=UPI00100BFB93|nr:hypothetical protein [Arcobacter sp. F2176]RXJ80206.1 hypothetical protein CRU95_12050 [Arcobacter sp. F2176]
MMKQSGILFIGKKIIKSLMLSSALLVSAQADFLMTLTDKNGTEESLCVKSYSFSNNLESLQKKVNQKDIYSEEETLTNKVFMGKPVFRKIVKLGDLSSFANNNNVWKNVNFNINNMETQISAIHFGSVNKTYGFIHTSENQFRDLIYKNYYRFVSSINYKNKLSDVNFIVEYTKTTDTAQTNPNELTTLVHYLPSDSTTNEYITKSMDDAGIRLQKNYTYDASTNSCTKN